MKTEAIIASAGLGKRIRSRTRKPYLNLSEKPILIHTLRALSGSGDIDSIIVVVNSLDKSRCADLIRQYEIGKVKSVISGGKERCDSVYNGLMALDDDTDIVVVHDGVRPFISADILKRSIAAAKKTGACVVGVPVKATVKRAKGGDVVEKTVDRSNLWEIQTPQVFRKDLILEAYKKFRAIKATDDSMLVEKLGAKVKIVAGSYNNIKITTPEDLIIGEAILRSGGLGGLKGLEKTKSALYRIGIGYDIHRLVKGRKLILGGVEIPHNKGLAGHSDADALLHAVSDAILGAAAKGDIGEHFPDDDARYKNSDSGELLKKVGVLVSGRGFKIANIDTIIIAQEPKVTPFKKRIKGRIARLLEISADKISVKAKTNEGLGDIGHKKAIAAYAAVLLYKET